MLRRERGSGNDQPRPLHAVVVPDLHEFRRRRIVNIRELIRFELEGLTVSLPTDQHLCDFTISIEPLPRDRGGRLRRDEIATALRQSCGVRVVWQPVSPGALTADASTADVVRLVQQFVGAEPQVAAHSNIELDLGLDSLRRIELIASLEAKLGVSLAHEDVQCAFTVGELAALAGRQLPLQRLDDDDRRERPAVLGGHAEEDHGESAWPSLLSHVPLALEQQAALLRNRTLAAPTLYLASRLVRRALFHTRVHGVEHLPREGPLILAPNHQSYLDPFALVGALPYRVFKRLFFVGAAEYFETRLTAVLAAQWNIVPVDPDASLVRAMQAAAFGLRAGKILVLFPEGERSIDGRVRTFKRGVGVLSAQLNVPVVPVAVSGTFEIWPRNRPLDLLRCLPFSRQRVRVAFGRPLVSGDHHELRERVAQMWSDLQERPSPP